jgi:hypothetical protein
MQRDAKRRAELRPQGITNLPCKTCEFFRVCGGVQTSRPLLDCFDETCCHKPDCDKVCPNNANFLPLLRDVGGSLDFNDPQPLDQPSLTLPWYIPLIDHRYSRQQPLQWPFVALDTYALFKLTNGRYRAIAESPEELRAAFNLSPATNIILRGVAKEPPLEEYWAYHQTERPADKLARLGISLAVGPNFSLLLDVPRPDSIWNRKRQLMCLMDMAEAGISVVPHLGAICPSDWKFWEDFLTTHNNICYVAKEFETGNRAPREGRKTIRDLAGLQQSLGRPLHPLLIAAAQFVELAAKHFERFTVIDSQPFFKSTFRQKFDSDSDKGRWVKTRTSAGQPLDQLHMDNITQYSSHVEHRVAASKNDYATRGSALPSA